MLLITIVLISFLLTSCAPPMSAQSKEPDWKIEPQYEQVTAFSEGISIVKTVDEGFYFIDQTGKNIFGREFATVQCGSEWKRLFVDTYPVVWDDLEKPSYFIDRDGTILPEPAYKITSADTLLSQNGYACATSTNGLMGLIDAKGQWVIPPVYNKVERINNGDQIRISHGNGMGFLDETLNVIFVENAVEIGAFQDDYAVVSVVESEEASLGEAHYNFIDASGKHLLSKPVGEAVPSLSEGIITYKENGLYGFMDTTGSILIPPSFAYAGSFHEGLAAVTNEKNEIGYIDVTGTLTIPFCKSEYGGDFQNGLASFGGGNGKEGLIDKKGTWVIPPKYYFCFYNKKTDVWQLEKTDNKETEDIFFPNTGLLVNEISLVADINQSYVVGWKGTHCVLIEINETGTITHKFDFIGTFSEGLAPARCNGLYGYIDTYGNWVLSPQFQGAEPFAEGTAAVAVGDKWGFISNPLIA